ncbi:tetratricopeptide repeat protein [Altericista sp. CCNU0014]|uniref:tetratricopeptide repeat protein n=1 Tax=Altericista sp. CCNU0014 TaxID=3082949 RepID=UPI00384CDC83
MAAKNAYGQSLSAPAPSSQVQPATPAPDAKAAVSAYVRQGDRAFAEGKYSEAIAAYTKALELFDTNEYAYYNRGNAYRKLKDYPKAIADLTKAIQLDPQNTFSYLYRGMAYQADNQVEKAIADYTALIKIDPQQPLAFLRRAEAYASQKQRDLATADFREASSLYKRQGDRVRAERVETQLRLLK